MPDPTSSEDGILTSLAGNSKTKKRRLLLIESDGEEELCETSANAEVSTTQACITTSSKKKRRKRRRSEARKHRMQSSEDNKIDLHNWTTQDVRYCQSLNASDKIELHRQSSPMCASQQSGITYSIQKNIASTSKASTSDKDTTEGSPTQSEIISKLNKTVQTQDTLLENILLSLTCQICLEPMSRPFTLAPCGHTSCYQCLLSWFRAAPPEAEVQPVSPYLANSLDPEQPGLLRIDSRLLLSKIKKCPQCRCTINEPPFEAWTIKAVIDVMRKSDLASTILPSARWSSEAVVSSSSKQNLWYGVFRSREDRTIQNMAFDDRELLQDDFNPQVAGPNDIGIFDEEDDVRRCTLCLHELWNSTCTGCGRNYPGLDLDHEADQDHGNHILPTRVGEADFVDQNLRRVIELQRAYVDLAMDAENDESASEDGSYESSFIDDDNMIQPIEINSDNSDNSNNSNNFDEEQYIEPWRSILDGDSQDESNDNDLLHRSNRRSARRTIVLSDDQLDISDPVESDSPDIRQTRRTGTRRRLVLLSDEESELDDIREVTVRPRPTLRRNTHSSRTLVVSDDESVESNIRRLYHSSDDDGVLSDNFSDDDAQRNLSDMISTRERALYGEDDFVIRADDENMFTDGE